MVNIADIEYIVLFAILAFLLIQSLKRRIGSPQTNMWRGVACFAVDKDFSTLLKAFSCVFILMGHFASRDVFADCNTVVDKAVYLTTANIALVVFMFFSGYGLSLKNYQGSNLLVEWWSRVKKIYFPLLFVGVFFVALCFILPDVYGQDVIHSRRLPLLIHESSVFNKDSWPLFFECLLGYSDWYVVCILYFYAIFYLSNHVADKTGWNLSVTLSVMMLIYFICAVFFYGEAQAHFFRYPCAFVLGHLVAKHNRASCSKRDNVIDSIIAFVFFASVAYCGIMWMIHYLLAFVMLMIASHLNRYFEVKRSSILFRLGTVSYFYYLSHERIGYPLMYYIFFDDILVWAILTGFISYLLWWLYQKIQTRAWAR